MKSIDYYIERVKENNIYGGKEKTKAYPFEEDGVILVKKPEKYFEELKKRIKKCKDLGINIPEYFDYKITDDSECWILEELAPGEQFANLVNNDDGQDIINSIPYEHIEKYIHDSYLLGINGIGVEPRRRNIFYDKEKGFTIIDVGVYHNNEDPDSLESCAYFFKMYSNVLLVRFTEDEKGQAISQKTHLNMIKAFEKGHPHFKKYSRWIYRGNENYAEVLEKIGNDLSLDNEEYNEFVLIINKLIDDIVNEKINNLEELFNNNKVTYIDLLSSSIDYCLQFNLYDTQRVTLDKYIKKQVYSKIKQLFFECPDDNSLKELYYRIRRKELDPARIYPTEVVNQMITEELDEINEQNKRGSK